MLTTRDAARLLAAAGHGAPLASLITPLGFDEPRVLPISEYPRLGLAEDPPRAWIAAGTGSLRALLLDWEGPVPLRERIVAHAARIARAAPGAHWLIIARHGARAELAVVAPAPEPRGPLDALLIESDAVRESDAETFALLASVHGDAEPLVHLRWRELLGRDALSRRFYRDLEGAVDALARTARGRADAADRRTVALLTASRLLFLAFLEAKGWLDRDRAFLRRQLERVAPRGPLHARFLEPLSFGTLNTPYDRRARAALAFGRVPFLNGGLFTRSALESRLRTLRLDDEAIAAVVCDLLPRYRLTARETSADLSDAAVDPEMLGRAFESLMQPETRRTRGAFYTPPPLIARVAGGALEALVAGPHAGDSLAPGTAALGSFRVIDPACGSGAFLVHALESLAARRIAAGDARPVCVVRRDVLTRSIFGVDIDPIAVWLCQLRLWLSVVVEDERDEPMRLPPLPNLDRNIRQGDALAGDAFEESAPAGGSSIVTLRLRYARASGARKRTLAGALDRAERTAAIAVIDARIATRTAQRRELLISARSPDLFASRRGPDAATRRALDELRDALRGLRADRRRLRDGGALPFSFATHFPEACASGGFDLVIGNPPWVRPHALPLATRDELRARFTVARHAAWESGADAAGAGRGFASQVDLAALFTERAVQLLRPTGALGFLLPSKLWTALAGGGVRDLLLHRTRLIAIDDWPGDAAGFEAVVYPSAVIARRGGGDGVMDVRVTQGAAAARRSFTLPAGVLGIDETRGAPWLLMPRDVRDAFDAVTVAGTPLSATAFGRPMLGVKSGCNDAFVVERAGSDAEGGDGLDPRELIGVRSGDAAGVVESSMLRPLVRGEHVRAWTRAPDAAASAIVWTHRPQGTALEALPPHTHRWLTHWRRRLESRTDGRHARWWSLFRTEAARADRPRVVWGDIGREPRALVLVAGDRTVPLNTCYVVRAPSEDDAFALAALLNSRLAAAWLGAVAEPARGGFRRFLGWTCARLPVPRDWDAARGVLAPIARAAASGYAPAQDVLTRAVVASYGLRYETVSPLLDWSP